MYTHTPTRKEEIGSFRVRVRELYPPTLYWSHCVCVFVCVYSGCVGYHLSIGKFSPNRFADLHLSVLLRMWELKCVLEESVCVVIMLVCMSLNMWPCVCAFMYAAEGESEDRERGRGREREKWREKGGRAVQKSNHLIAAFFISIFCFMALRGPGVAGQVIHGCHGAREQRHPSSLAAATATEPAQLPWWIWLVCFFLFFAKRAEQRLAVLNVDTRWGLPRHSLWRCTFLHLVFSLSLILPLSPLLLFALYFHLWCETKKKERRRKEKVGDGDGDGPNIRALEKRESALSLSLSFFSRLNLRMEG